ncbi:MAG: metal ABC transporter permease [Rhodocyclaceae bacterium]|jgi:zinc transport system permease protein|nr:metal ABC transporter permease [Rhodocyclaceae bacterium]
MDSLFVVPFFAGLALALLLPLVGNLLRLRDEWLATLGLAHLAAAGALLGMALHLPTFVGALAGALTGAGTKQASGGRSNSAYGLMILAGWALTLLVAANTALGDALAHALIDGQLYFAGWREFVIDAVVLLMVLSALRWLTPHLIAARLFPERERANKLPAWRWHLGFDFLAATAIAAGTATFGLMASFALIFVPPWIAFRLAPDWRRAQWLAAGIGVAGYGAAFWLALALDQPFGPVLVTVLVLSYALSTLWRRPASADFQMTDAR